MEAQPHEIRSHRAPAKAPVWFLFGSILILVASVIWSVEHHIANSKLTADPQPLIVGTYTCVVAETEEGFQQQCTIIPPTSPSATSSPTDSASPTGTPTSTPTATASPTLTPSPTSTPSSTTPPPSSSASTPPPTTVSSTPTTTPAPGPPSFDPAWWVTNTGVPSGTVLTGYTGPCTIQTNNTVITNSDMRSRCPNGVTIQASNVLIQRSLLRNLVSDTNSSSVRAERVDIDGGQSSNFPTVAYRGITLVGANVHGGQHSLQCSGNCTAIDSWFHDTWLPDSSSAHENGIISNGGSHGLFRHNRIQCDHPGGNPSGGGCSGDASLFGDFGVISDWTFDQNLFMTTGGSFCTYAGNNPGKAHPVADHIVYTNNVFQKAYPTNNGHQPGSPGCAYYGPVTGFPGSSSAGNVWSGNVFDTGGVVSPA